jgi:hypothetical protein
MKDVLDAPESSLSTRGRIAIALAILILFGIALWVGLEMALRLTSGQS